ncbi:SGNH/GDSL hydrolase family protein [Metamycoplasma hominis]|uniref:SGNH/GDSL hydrolase family protein n=1 Tax=Metamycoplasma hominis TaxID=2098 RepID=UPI003CEAB6D5
MKKSTKILKAIVALGITSSIASSSLVAISCKDKTQKPDIKITQSENKVSKKINYVALGDDFAAGYNSSSNYYFNNEYDSKNDLVLGTSYPSYIANFIKLLSDKQTTLSTYYNYGLPLSNVNDWISLLSLDDKKESAHLNQVISYNQNLLSKFNSAKLNNLFGDFSNKKLQELIKNIKQANLITISLGFNDLFEQSSFFKEAFDLLRENKNKEEILKYFSKILLEFKRNCKNFEDSYSKLISIIKQYNPKANINLVGYISPYLKLTKLIDKQYNISLTNDCIEELNKSLANIAKTNKLNYLNINNDIKNLKDNADKLNNNFFDCFPSNNLYKKLAQDIFMKMSLPNNKYKELVDNNSNLNEFSQSLEFSKTPSEIFSMILGINGNSVDSFEKEYTFEENADIKNINSSYNSNHIILQLKSMLNSNKNIEDKEILNTFSILFGLIGLDPKDLNSFNKCLLESLKNKESKKSIINFLNFFIDSKNLSKSFLDINNALNNAINKKSYAGLNFEEIKKIVYSTTTSKQNIYEILKEIFYNKSLSQDLKRSEYAKLFKAIFSDVFIKKILKRLLPQTTVDLFKNLFNNKDIEKGLDNIFQKVLNLLINNSDKYFKFEKIDDFITTLVHDSSKDVNDLVSLIIKEISKDSKLANYLTGKIVDSLYKSYDLDLLEKPNISLFVSTFFDNISNFDGLSQISNIIIQILMNSKLDDDHQNRDLISEILNGILFDKYDLNRDNSLLFKILSFEPKIQNINDYKQGLKHLALKYAIKNNALMPKNIGKLIDKDSRENILRFYKNIALNAKKNLNEFGSEIFKDIISLLVNELFKNNSLFSQLIDQIGNYVVIQPIVAFVKSINYKKIFNNEEEIQKFVENVWDQLISTIRSEKVLGCLKNILNDFISGNNEYDFSSSYNFLVSFLKNSKKNGSIDLLKTVISEIATNTKFIDKAVELGAIWLKKEANTELNDKEIKEISNYLIKLINSITKSNLVTKLIENFDEKIQILDNKKIDTFDKLKNYLKSIFSDYFNIEKNKDLINNFVDLLLEKDNKSEGIKFSELIKTLSVLASKSELVNYVFKKFDIKSIILNYLDSFKDNKLSNDTELNSLLQTLITKTRNYIDSQWENELLPKIKSIIELSAIDNKVIESKNINEFVANVISKNVGMVKEILNNFLDKEIKSNEEIKGGLFKLLKKQYPQFLAGIDSESNIEKLVSKLIDFALQKQNVDLLVSTFASYISKYIENNGFNLDKISWSNALDLKNLIKHLFNYEQLNSLIDTLNEENVKTLFLILIKNLNEFANVVLANNDTTTQKQNEGSKPIKLDNDLNFEQIFLLIKKLWNKLASSKSTIINELKPEVQKLLKNENLKQYLTKIINNELKNVHNEVLNKVNTNDNNLANFIVDKFDKIIDNKLIDKVFEFIENLIENGSEYDAQTLPEFINKILKNLADNKGFDALEQLLENVLSNKDITQKLVEFLVAFLEIEAKTKLNSDEINQLTNYFNKILPTSLKSNLYKNLKIKLTNELKSINKYSWASILESVTKTIKNYFSFNNGELIKDVQQFLTKKYEEQEINQIKDVELIKILKIVLEKETFINYISNKINIKEIILKYIDEINISSFKGDVQENLQQIISYIKSFVETSYNEDLLPLIKELIKKLFDDNNLKDLNNISQWISKFISNNKEYVIKKIKEIFNKFINNKTLGIDIKNSIAKLLISLMEQNLKNITWPVNAKETLLKLISLGIEKLPEFNILDGLIKNVLDYSVNNLNKNQFEFKKYDWNNLINIVSIINNLNYDKIIEFVKSLKSEDIKNIALLLLKNIKNFENIIPDYSNESQSLPEHKNLDSSSTNIVGFDGQIKVNINVYFNLFKCVFSILDNKAKKEIKDELKNSVDIFLQSNKFKQYIKHNLLKIKEKILKIDSKASELGNEIVETLMKVIFDSNNTKEFILTLLNSFIDLGDNNQWASISDFNGLFKHLLSANKDKFKAFIKNAVNEMTSNKNLINKSIEYALNLFNKKYSISSSSAQIQGIANLLTRLINKLGSMNVFSNILGDFIDLFVDVDLLDNNGHFNGNALASKLLESIKKIEYHKYLTTENLSELFETILDKNIDKNVLYNELNFAYSYIVDNLDKFKQAFSAKSNSTTFNEVDKTKQDKEHEQFLKNLEKLIYNALKALNGSIKADNKNGKEALVEFVYNVLKDQIKKFNWDDLKQDIIPKDKLELISKKFIDFPEIKSLIEAVVNDFLAGSKIESTNLGDLISKTITRIQDNLIKNFSELIKHLATDDEITNHIVESILNYLKIEGNDEDKKFLKDLIGKIVPALLNNDFIKRKFIKRSIGLISNYAKQFDILNPVKWLNDAIEKIKSAFSFNDVLVLSELVGEDKPINETALVKLINLVFGKSNFDDSVIYNALRNLNNNSDESKRSNMNTLNSSVSNALGSIFKSSKATDKDDPDNIDYSADVLKLLDTIYKLLAKAYNNDKDATSATYKVRAQSEAWKAVYRFNVAVDFAIFEMFGRETLEKDREPGTWKNAPTLSLYQGTRAILWEFQEGTNLKAIPGVSSKFTGMQAYFKNPERRREFTNYVYNETRGWLFSSWEYYKEENYGPESITYLIATSGYNKSESSKLKNVNFKVEENGKPNEVSKKEYILMTIKEGGYRKFMNMNNKTSINKWSGLDKIRKGDY